jgi:inhibitor of cysteine peptidase
MLMAIACLSQAACAETKIITDADKGGEVHLKVGDTLELRLKSNPTTGYMWFLKKESTALLKLARQTSVDAEAQPTEQVVGRPGLQIFFFEPRRPGDGRLLLHHVRSWDPPSPDEEQFEIHVVIE